MVIGCVWNRWSCCSRSCSFVWMDITGCTVFGHWKQEKVRKGGVFSGLISLEGGGLAWVHGKWDFTFVVSCVLSQLISCSQIRGSDPLHLHKSHGDGVSRKTQSVFYGKRSKYRAGFPCVARLTGDTGEDHPLVGKKVSQVRLTFFPSQMRLTFFLQLI